MKGNIGIILNDVSKQGLNHGFFAGIIEGFRQKCGEEDYRISFLNSIRNENSTATYLEQARKDGYDAVLLACAEQDEEIDELIKSEIIVGTIDRDNEGVINVSSDNSAGMKALMDYIFEMGHRRVAIITGDDNIVCNIRLNEYLKAFEKHNLQVKDEYIVRGQFREIELTYYLTEKLLKLEEAPTCIIFSDDYAAIGGINAIKARGLDIPRDISVAGYDGDVVMSKLEPSLTSVGQNTELMGRCMAEKLIHAIEHPEDKAAPGELVNTNLKIGRSITRVYA